MIEHGQFEEWIWSEEELDPEQSAGLQEHLSACEECRELKASWENFHDRLMAAQVVPAPPNFSGRWNFDLAERKVLARNIQVRRMALYSSVSVVLSFLAAIGLTFYISSPVDLIIGIVESASGLITLTNQLRSIFTSLIQVIPPIIPAVYWLVITSIFCLLASLWIISIWRISKQGVYLK